LFLGENTQKYVGKINIVIQKRYQSRKKREFVKANHNIRFPEVRVLSERGEAVGMMSSQEALNMAQKEGLDLVLITEHAKPPVVKIIELSKHKYQLKQKRSVNRKSAKAQELKEVRFSPFMADGDFEARLKKVIAFLDRGDKVRLNLLFKGRAITKKEFGFDLFDKIIKRTEEIAVIEMKPKMLGRKLIAQLSPSAKKKVIEKNEKN